MSMQKVIIPQGIINPGETTIIEIPKRFQGSPAVVAKIKTMNCPTKDSDKAVSRKSVVHPSETIIEEEEIIEANPKPNVKRSLRRPSLHPLKTSHEEEAGDSSFENQRSFYKKIIKKKTITTPVSSKDDSSVRKFCLRKEHRLHPPPRPGSPYRHFPAMGIFYCDQSGNIDLNYMREYSRPRASSPGPMPSPVSEASACSPACPSRQNDTFGQYTRGPQDFSFGASPGRNDTFGQYTRGPNDFSVSTPSGRNDTFGQYTRSPQTNSCGCSPGNDTFGQYTRGPADFSFGGSPGRRDNYDQFSRGVPFTSSPLSSRRPDISDVNTKGDANMPECCKPKIPSGRNTTFPRAKMPGYGELHDKGISYGGYAADYSPNLSDTFHRDYGIGKKEAGTTPMSNLSWPRTKYAGCGGLHDAGLTYGGHPQDFQPDLDDTFHQEYGLGNKDKGLSQTPSFSRKVTKKKTTITKGSPDTSSSVMDSKDAGMESSYYLGKNPRPATPPAIAKQREYPERFLPCFTSTPKHDNPWVPEWSKAPDKEIEKVLDNMESAETNRIHQDLKDFQAARRRLIYDATNINGPP